MSVNKKSKIKIIIICLSVLLTVSLLGLAGTLIYNYFSGSQSVSVSVPDNLIVPGNDETNAQYTDNIETDAAEEDRISVQQSATGESNAAEEDKINAQQSGNRKETNTDDSREDSANEIKSVSQSVSDRSDPDAKATVLSLNNRNAGDNTPFQAGNMFPGDSETKYYCVRVSHKDDVILRFHADVRQGYDKLAEVLCCRIVLPETGEVLYDGLMRDMPESLNHELGTSTGTTSEVYYCITAYLDTGVGNEYMNKDLIADFNWWVQETENLDAPQTGDSLNIDLWLCIASASLFLLILLLRKRKKEDAVNEQ